jgi:hypothetical protein
MRLIRIFTDCTLGSQALLYFQGSSEVSVGNHQFRSATFAGASVVQGE